MLQNMKIGCFWREITVWERKEERRGEFETWSEMGIFSLNTYIYNKE